jgi:hypothetical protein
VISLTGSTDTHGISISGSTVDIELQNTSISGANPFVIDNSIVSIRSVGSNSISGQSSGIQCSGYSNVTFLSSNTNNLNLSVAGGPGGSAIGASGTTCGQLLFLNGTYEIRGSENGTGIGAAGQGSYVQEIRISGGDFTIDTDSGTAIGSGRINGGYSTVDTISITGGELLVDSLHGTGIGSGSTYGGVSSVNLISLANLNLTTTTTSTSIGSGYVCSGTGESRVGKILIESGNFDLTAEFGAGIGTGHACSGITSVSNITIINGSFSIRTINSSTIGTGLATTGYNSISGILLVDGIFDLTTDAGAG